MSEALLASELPRDYPAVDTPENRLNIRKALAGLYLLQGEGSQFRCLMKAGYSRSTAKKLTANGLTAKRCLEETAKLDNSANPAKMLEVARRRAMLSMESIDPKTAPLKDVVRMLDTVEKYYGGQIPAMHATLTLSDRLSGMVALLAVAAARGLPVPALPQPYTEAQIVESDNKVESQAVASKDDAILAAGNGSFVNSAGAPLSPDQRNINSPTRDINPNF